ncbi:MAG: serine hydrolase [Myxococcales bacterium]|nr:serine hydrolase [Myxococcales bacterium]
MRQGNGCRSAGRARLALVVLCCATVCRCAGSPGAEDVDGTADGSGDEGGAIEALDTEDVPDAPDDPGPDGVPDVPPADAPPDDAGRDVFDAPDEGLADEAGGDGPVEDGDDAGAVCSGIRDDALGPWPWHRQAPYAIDGYSLAPWFAAHGYAPPGGSEILVGRVVAGVGQPAYQLYDLSGSAFSFDFWPASTVKLLAAAGALDFLAELGLTGDATVTMRYDDGTVFTRRVRDIYTPAIAVSSNADYDRCVEIAGFDRLNTVFLSPERDLPATVIQRRYGYAGSLRVSPALEFVEGSRTASVPRRVGTGDYACPREGNCANLFELLNALRRVVLHDEIPDAERFDLAPQDVLGLQTALADAPSFFEPAILDRFGADAVIYNKPGYVPGDDILDHGVVVDLSSGERYLVAVSVPETTSSEAELSAFVGQALSAVLSFDAARAMPWQYDAGIPIRVQLDDGGVVGERRRMLFTVEAPGADRLRFWTDTWFLGEASGGPCFTFTYDYQRGGERLLVVQASSGGVPVGYRALAVSVPPP